MKINKKDNILKNFKNGFKINEILTVTQWSEKNRYLSSDISAEGGLYRVSRTPYFEQIMNDLSENSTKQKVVVMMGAQLGKSEAGNNFLGYCVDQIGGSIMVVQPTEDAVKKFLRQRIDPMIENCPSLLDKFKKNDGKKMIDNTTQKDFIGGTLTFAYSTSASTLASTPVKFLFLDEVDRFKEDVGNEGDPVNLAIRRTSTFVDKKILMVSTPTLEHKSKIYKEFLKGDCQHFIMQCPYCKQEELEFLKENFDYKVNKNGETFEEGFLCNVCKNKIYEKQKFNLVKNGKWKSTVVATDKKVASYYLNSAYSLLGFSWSDLAKEVEEAKYDDEKNKAVENTLWGLPFKENVLDTIDSQELLDIRIRNEDEYGDFLNDDDLYINMCVDTQDNRMCYVIVVYNNKGRKKILRYDEIYGDVASDNMFKILDGIAANKFYYNNNKNEYLTISKILVDSGGHYTSEIYEQINKRDKRWCAIKGYNNGPFYKESENTYLQTDENGKPFAGAKKLVLLNVFNGKKHILNSLKVENFEENNYIHINFKKFDITFFDMLTSEVIVRKRKNGIFVDEFKKIKDRNEALDLMCYSYCDLKSTGLLDLADENIEKYKKINVKYEENGENLGNLDENYTVKRQIIQPDFNF